MSVENGEWIMKGLDVKDPLRIRSSKDLVSFINEVGFLPLFGNEVAGFSVEERTASYYWWTGNRKEDPWEWREIIAAGHEVAYGKFFDKKAGFISLKWLPYFVNYRRNGYDFDAAYEDGLASRREKIIMDFYMGEDENGDTLYKKDRILSTELKKLAGFGKSGEKNYPGIMTGLQMKLYLVTDEFRRRKNKQGEEYGMAVSLPITPEAVWGYDAVTSAYKESPFKSWEKIIEHVKALYPEAGEKEIVRLIGKAP